MHVKCAYNNNNNKKQKNTRKHKKTDFLNIFITLVVVVTVSQVYDMSKLVTLYTLSMCRFLCIKYISIKKEGREGERERETKEGRKKGRKEKEGKEGGKEGRKKEKNAWCFKPLNLGVVCYTATAN